MVCEFKRYDLGWSQASILSVGGNTVVWVKPPTSDFEVVAQRLDGQGSFVVQETCCPADPVVRTMLYFSVSGCWKVSAYTHEVSLSFTTLVLPKDAVRTFETDKDGNVVVIPPRSKY